ncbi:hypothetical protein HDU99_005466 [Rhizoclosmatium hyalinum]|nr:hypothetical protein HDU99_005466 [Rhizoclosmatium hyalinum]
MAPRPIKKNDRQSLNHTSYNEPMKKNGAGKWNFGSYEDDVMDYYMNVHHSSSAAAKSSGAKPIGANKVQVVDEAAFSLAKEW